MMNSDMGTQHFKTISDNPQDAQTILLCVYHALSAKGYDPITQIVGYLIHCMNRTRAGVQYDIVSI